MIRSVRFTALVVLLLAFVALALPLQAAAAAPDAAASGAAAPGAPAPSAVVHAVYFFSPTCPHCHVVSTEVLPPLRAQYGDSLVMVYLDTTTAQGSALWQAAVTLYNPPVTGVPLLIVGDRALVGSVEIPDQFPGLIDSYLAAGGVDWPALPGMDAAIADVGTAVPSAPGDFFKTAGPRFAQDPVANSIATVVLVALVVGLVAVVRPRPWQLKLTKRVGHVGMAVLMAIGLIAASYLTYVETTGNEAVCGPLGDCNAVQTSQYAMLFGFLPVAVLGVIGYVAIIGSWVYATWFEGSETHYGHAAAFALSAFGLLFFIRLTFLEPFVIGATCAWCLTGAVAMLCITLLSAGPGWQAIRWLGRHYGVSKRRRRGRRRY